MKAGLQSWCNCWSPHGGSEVCTLIYSKGSMKQSRVALETILLPQPHKQGNLAAFNYLAASLPLLPLILSLLSLSRTKMSSSFLLWKNLKALLRVYLQNKQQFALTLQLQSTLFGIFVLQIKQIFAWQPHKGNWAGRKLHGVVCLVPDPARSVVT